MSRQLHLYDSIISKYHFAYLPWFNKGITYYNLNRMDEAKKCLQQALLINPYYTPAHFQLGVIALNEGQLVPAILSFCTNLLIDPENSLCVQQCNMAEQHCKNERRGGAKVAGKKQSLYNDFEMIQEIVSSKLPLIRVIN